MSLCYFRLSLALQGKNIHLYSVYVITVTIILYSSGQWRGRNKCVTTPPPINTNSSLAFLSWPSLMSLFISLISSLFSLQTHWQTARASTVLSIIALIKWADIFLCVTNGCWTRLIHNLWWVIDPRPAARLLWSVRLSVCHLFGFFEFPAVFSVDILMHSHSLCPFILNVYFRKGEHSFRKKNPQHISYIFHKHRAHPMNVNFFVTIGKSNTYLGLIYINLNIPFQFYFCK